MVRNLNAENYEIQSSSESDRTNSCVKLNKKYNVKNRIIEICELGQPQSIIRRENQQITELIKTVDLIEELNKQLTIQRAVGQSEQLAAFLKWYCENDECPDLVTYEAAAERYLSR